MITGTLEAFKDLPDPRWRKCKYSLEELLLSALSAMLCGVEDFETISLWGEAHLEWLKKFLAFENGIASPDTYRRVFGALNPGYFEECFINWMLSWCPNLEGKHVAIDGKSVRGSRHGETSAIHLVSAWCSENGLSLGQVRTEEKSNEITAIPELLKALELRGAVITIDAMGTQHEIACSIIDAQANYILAVKENQPRLATAIQEWFKSARQGKLESSYWEDIEHDKGHGRLETRICRVTDDVGWLSATGHDWSGIKRLVMVESHRTLKEKTTVENRYYISSCEVKAREMAQFIRAHWGIENSLHWVLDVSWGEDACTVRDHRAAQNLALLRKITLNLVRQAPTYNKKRVSLKNARNLAAWDENYREEVLGLI